MTAVVIVIVVIVVLLAVSVVVSYNRFVRQRNLVRESWRQIDVELQRRHDLIPNLIETVKGYAAQERNVLTQVTEARTAAIQARQSNQAGPAQMAQAENSLQRSLGGLFAVAESYPELKSNQNFLELQRQLADTEDRIAAGRRFYNGNVRAINTRVEAFPSSIIASMFHFSTEQYFEVDDPQVRSNVAVDFSSLTGGQPPAAPNPGLPAGQPPVTGPAGPPPVTGPAGQPPVQGPGNPPPLGGPQGPNTPPPPA
jgi:LemA protein